jgi:hypothetical protein
MKRSKYLVRGLTYVGALAILPLFTAAQNKPATLEEALAQIETLKKQMAELETYVRGQIQQTATNVPAAAAANVVAKAESKTAPPAAASADSNYVKWNELTVGKSKFKLYGFLRLDAVYDDSRPGGNGINSAHIPATILSENGLGGAANLAPSKNHDNLLIHPRLTRFGIDFTGPEVPALWGAKTGGKLEIDFYNFVPAPATAAESREFPRLRHAYATMKWDEFSLLAGQTSDLISQYYPIVNPDFVMWGAGNLGDRRPQLRLEYTPKIGHGTAFFQTMAGLTGADDNRDLDTNGIRDGEASGQPTLQARLGYRLPVWEKQSIELAVWGHHARERVDLGLPPGGRRNFDSDAVGLDFAAPIFRDIVSFKAEAWTGRNLDDIRGGILQGINTGTGKTIRASGGWAEIMFRPCKWYSLSGGYSIDNPRNADLPAQAPAENRIWYVANRFGFDPIEFGLDYLNWSTDYKDPAGKGQGQDNRVQAYISYKF